MVPLVAVKTPDEVTENLPLIDIEPAVTVPKLAEIALRLLTLSLSVVMALEAILSAVIVPAAICNAVMEPV